MARVRKKHPPAFKAQVALEAAGQTETIAELAEQYQVHPVQISWWKKQLLDGMEALFQSGSAARQADPEELPAELYEQLGRLRMELARVEKICLLRSRPSGPGSSRIILARAFAGDASCWGSTGRATITSRRRPRTCD